MLFIVIDEVDMYSIKRVIKAQTKSVKYFFLE